MRDEVGKVKVQEEEKENSHLEERAFRCVDRLNKGEGRRAFPRVDNIVAHQHEFILLMDC